MARRETQERVGLGRLDMRQPLRVSQQPAGLVKPQQMGIKLLDDLVDMGLHPRPQTLQGPGGGQIQPDKGFAGLQLSRGQLWKGISFTGMRGHARLLRARILTRGGSAEYAGQPLNWCSNASACRCAGIIVNWFQLLHH
jgi:hypothetical protein